MLRQLGLYLTQRERNALWVVAVCAILASLQLPTFSIGVIIVGLVTLYRGAREGAPLLFCLLLPNLIAAIFGSFDAIWLISALGKGLVVYFLACVLANTASWTVVLQLTAGLGVLLISLTYLIVPDIAAWWALQLAPYSAEMQAAFGATIPPEQAKLIFNRVADLATSVITTSILALDILLLLLARGWQALLFNPGGLAKEWKQLRLDYKYTLVVLLTLSAVWLDAAWAVNLVPVLLMPLIFSALSLLHAKLPEQKHVRIPLLILIYTALALAEPFTVILLIFLALIDSWYNFRAVRKKPN